MSVDATLRDSICQYATARGYQPAFVQRWLALDARDARALYELATDLRLGQNQLRDLWEWAEDIADRDSLAIADVIEEPEVRAARSAKLGRNDRLHRVRQLLRRRRFPQLAAAEERAEALVRGAGLPPNVRIHLPPFLEGNTITITCHGRGRAELEAALQAALHWVRSDFCAALTALLEGGS